MITCFSVFIGLHHKLRLIKTLAQDPNDTDYLATYIKGNIQTLSFALITLFLSIGFFGFSEIQASQEENTINQKNSQTLALLSPDFGTRVPSAVGGPIYTAQRNDILIAQMSVSTSDVSSINIEDTNGIGIYVVRSGDTLSGIAELFDVSVNTIKWENNMSKNTLKVGQELRILPVTGVSHTVKKGETFGKIAQMYDVETEDITVFNDFDEKSLKIGEKIIIPNGVKKTVVKKVTQSSVRTNAIISSTRAASGYYMRPTAGIITSKFGPRWGRYHYGIDFGGAVGTPIVAAANGTVKKIGCGRGYGNCLVVEHPNGTQTLYAHANKIFVGIGSSVKQGQKIASVGKTGNVTGPHLHFEIIKSNGQKMNTNGMF